MHSVILVIHPGALGDVLQAVPAGNSGLRSLRLIEPPLHLLAAVLTLALAYLGSDCGVSHLAASVGTASVILFPPNTKDLWRPWSPSTQPVVVEGRPDEADVVRRAVTERLAASRSERRHACASRGR